MAYGMDEARRVQTYLTSRVSKQPTAPSAVPRPKIPEGAGPEPRTVIPQAPSSPAVVEGGAGGAGEAKPTPAAPVGSSGLP